MNIFSIIKYTPLIELNGGIEKSPLMSCPTTNMYVYFWRIYV